MGAQVSSFGSERVSSHPNEKDWLSAHVTASGLGRAEVERLWLRFQQLGADVNGQLHEDILDVPPASEDIFVRNILSHLIIGDEEQVEFLTFLRIMKWAETASTDEKIKATFGLINDGEVVPKDLLIKVLHRVYPEVTQDGISKLTDVFMDEIDKKKQGYIEEAQFVGWVHTLPAETLSSILEFHIIPPDLQSPLPPSTTDSQLPQSKVVNDAILQEVATLVQKRDWPQLANQLGFTTKDVNTFTKKFRNDQKQQVYTMLVAWQQSEGDDALVDDLQMALRECRMSDVADKLDMMEE